MNTTYTVSLTETELRLLQYLILDGDLIGPDQDIADALEYHIAHMLIGDEVKCGQ